ncbi:MAG: LPXTG cell wall anchor domain-containing protein [Bacilli bacterium]|nr:LPXTG cell wall anchor domain-containing protein [Bacilli bacterium]
MILVKTFSDALNEFLKTNALWLALAVVGAILIALALILILNKKKK